MYNKLTFTVKGVSPLMMHNGQLADPLNKWAKQLAALTSKRKKTDADHAEISRVEFLGGLYINGDGCPVVPGECIERCLVEAAKKSKLGKLFTSAVLCDGNWPLDYKGPKEPDLLASDPNFCDRRSVVIQRNRIVRTRPIFRKWELAFTVHYLPNELEKEQLTQAVDVGGRLIGLLDYRPKYGRFELVSVEAK